MRWKVRSSSPVHPLSSVDPGTLRRTFHIQKKCGRQCFAVSAAGKSEFNFQLIQCHRYGYFQALKIEYEDQKILDAIWNVIDVCTESVVKTPDEVLRDVSLDVVTVFLARDSLMVPNELHLYDFLTRYQIK